MFLEIITLLIVVVSPLLLVWYILSKLKKNSELDRVRQDRVTTRIEQLARQTVDAAKVIVNHQASLNKDVEDLRKHIDERAIFIALQQELFETLAKSDVIAARRDELLRTKELKVALERLMGVALTSRQPAAPNDIVALENLTIRIKELETILGLGDRIDKMRD
jgi:hypothetical protein